MVSIDEFLSRLKKVRKTGHKSWIACCSAHQDKNPSMTVSEGSDGRILIHCFSQQCGIDDITAAVGLEVKDLMPKNLNYHRMKPLRMAVNPKDALCAMKTELTRALLILKDVQSMKATPDAALDLARIIGRVQLTIDLAGGER